MHRIQVQLTPEQERMLRELAAVRGSSISALIREGVDALLAPTAGDQQRRRERMLKAVGLFGSGLHDVSARHDDYLADDIAERKTHPKK
ncbi:MAG TPA: ribbon-helix-helix protein, CopG family [Candidatus Baltobacteraceae bacterium]|nr:ribbon-helix-helix protein, CopG family [Candidatus Baltobacteraceae bacterium]